MADMRRRSPEPPPGAPQIQFKPGIAKETLRELAPLLAEEGIDIVPAWTPCRRRCTGRLSGTT